MHRQTEYLTFKLPLLIHRAGLGTGHRHLFILFCFCHVSASEETMPAFYTEKKTFVMSLWPLAAGNDAKRHCVWLLKYANTASSNEAAIYCWSGFERTKNKCELQLVRFIHIPVNWSQLNNLIIYLQCYQTKWNDEHIQSHPINNNLVFNYIRNTHQQSQFE